MVFKGAGISDSTMDKDDADVVKEGVVLDGTRSLVENIVLVMMELEAIGVKLVEASWLRRKYLELLQDLAYTGLSKTAGCIDHIRLTKIDLSINQKGY